MGKKSSVIFVESRNKKRPLYIMITELDIRPTLEWMFPGSEFGVMDVNGCDPLELSIFFEAYLDVEPLKKPRIMSINDMNALTGFEYHNYVKDDVIPNPLILHEFDPDSRINAVYAIERAGDYFSRVKYSSKQKIEDAIKGPGFLMFRDY